MTRITFVFNSLDDLFSVASKAKFNNWRIVSMKGKKLVIARQTDICDNFETYSFLSESLLSSYPRQIKVTETFQKRTI